MFTKVNIDVPRRKLIASSRSCSCDEYRDQCAECFCDVPKISTLLRLDVDLLRLSPCGVLPASWLNGVRIKTVFGLLLDAPATMRRLTFFCPRHHRDGI